METTFRWRSWLGASVIVFLIFGVINVGLAIAVPATLHLSGSFPGVVFGAGDAQLLGLVCWPAASASGILAPVHHRRLATIGMCHRPGHPRNGMRIQHWERHQ